MELLVDSFGGGVGVPAALVSVVPSFPVLPSTTPVSPGIGVPALSGLGGAEIIGFREASPIASRLVWASMVARYQPSHAPLEQCLFGMDFSFVLPAGVGIRAASINIYNNTFLSPDVSADWVIGSMVIRGARVWTRLQGGVEGQDYQLRWSVADTDDNVWVRTALVLCSQAG